ncbi:MAG: hypothetical protein IT429_18715 [Gemmataceae bacterium]|nr:hypothetical protein [Gemmataceae bacterium]
MPIVNPRNRIVIFRLTQDEYDSIRNVSTARGARNLSEFARSLLLGAVRQPERESVMAEMAGALSGLRESVQRMAERMDRMDPAAELRETARSEN